MKFYSWIPTVSGRLSYSHIGESSFPYKCVQFNEIGKGNKGQAIVLQKRYTDDFVFPLPNRWSAIRTSIASCVSRIFRGEKLSGKHYFLAVFDRVLDRQSPDSDIPLDTLEGRVFPILLISNPDGTRADSIVKQLRRTISSFPAHGDEAASSELKSLIEQIDGDLADFSPIQVKFKIRRNGITELEPEVVSTGLSSKIQISDQNIRDYTEQSFFFLRDIAHNHQHHEPESDTIIRVHDATDDYVQQIYFDLFRYIVRFKRVRSPENIMRASGILAYANSFKKISVTDGQLPNDYQIENLKMSLDSAQFELEYNAQKQSSLLTLVLTLIFSFFGLCLSLAALSQFAPSEDKSQIQPSKQLIEFTSWVAMNPGSFVIYGAIVFVSILLLTGKYKPNRHNVIENIQRLFSHLRKWLFLLPLLILGTCLIFLGLWLYISGQF